MLTLGILSFDTDSSFRIGRFGRALQWGAGSAALPGAVYDIDFTAAAVPGGTVTLGGTDSWDSTTGSTVGYVSLSGYAATEAVTLGQVLFASTTTVGTSVVQACVYSDNAGVPDTLLAQSSPVTGVTTGTNVLPLTASVAVAAGQTVWIGVLCTVASYTLRRKLSATGVVSRYKSASSVPSPAGSTTSTINTRYAIWAEGTGSVSPAVAALAAAGFTFSRSSIALGLDGTVFAIDAPRLGPSGLLIEGSRTNHFTYSNDLTNAVWTKVGVTPATTAGTAPGGAYGATVLTESSATELHYAYQSWFFLTATAYAWSAYVKAVAGTRWARLTLPVEAFGTALSANFDLTTGAITVTGGSPTCTATSIGDGWWRVSIAATTTATATASAAVGMAATASGSATYAGNGSSAIRVAFAQLETGSFPSSPIPTSGSAVSRSAETCVATRSAGTLNQGTVALDVALAPGFATLEHQYQWSVDDGTTSNALVIYRKVDTQQFAGLLNNGGSLHVNAVTGTPTNGGTHRLAARWATNSFALSADGAAPVTDTSLTVPSLTTERLGYGMAANRISWGAIRRARRWSAALDDATLRSLSAP